MEIKVFAPATVSNVGCGFDIMGFAMQNPGDEMIVRTNDQKKLIIENQTNIAVPLEPTKNVTTIAIQAMLRKLESKQGFTIIYTKKISSGSGIGSSGASAVAGVFAVNKLLSETFSNYELLKFAMEGEVISSGSIHADNVAPALIGGFCIIKSCEPLDIISIPFPEELTTVVFLPNISLPTIEMRRILPKEVSLKTATMQWANVATLTAALMLNDTKRIADSLIDYIVEPARSKFIPNYTEIKHTMLRSGALGASISGSGPAIFSLTENQDKAETVSRAVSNLCNDLKIEGRIFISKISKEGARVVQLNDYK